MFGTFRPYNAPDELFRLCDDPHWFPAPEKLQRLAICAHNAGVRHASTDPLARWKEWQDHPGGTKLWLWGLKKFHALKELIIILDAGTNLEFDDLLESWQGPDDQADRFLMRAILQDFEQSKTSPKGFALMDLKVSFRQRRRA